MSAGKAGGWRTVYAWRSRAETYVTVPMLALVLLQGSAVVETVTPGYWTAAVAKANLMLFIVVPVCAVCAAWEGVRHRSGGIDKQTVARPMWLVVLVAVAPTLLMGLAGVVVALLSTAPAAAGAPGRPHLGLIGVYLLVMVGHTVVGYGLGRWLPPALALPVSLGGSYIWLAYPAAVEPFWIRHLNGLSFEGCCAIDRQPDSRALLATALFAVGIGAGALIALAGSRRARIGGAVSFAALLAVAVTVAMPLGPSSGGPRAGAPHCTGEQPTLCLWPEQEETRGAVGPALASAYARLAQVGITLPGTVTTDEDSATEAVFIVLPANPDPQAAVLSLVSSVVPDTFPECATQGEWPGAHSRPVLLVWMALVAGISASELGPVAPPELIDLAVQVRRLDEQRQLVWYRANLAPLADCTTAPRLDPESFASEVPQ